MCIYVRVYIYIYIGARAQGNMVGGQKYARFLGTLYTVGRVIMGTQMVLCLRKIKWTMQWTRAGDEHYDSRLVDLFFRVGVRKEWERTCELPLFYFRL